jgi:hypothetical protein
MIKSRAPDCEPRRRAAPQAHKSPGRRRYLGRDNRARFTGVVLWRTRLVDVERLARIARRGARRAPGCQSLSGPWPEKGAQFQGRTSERRTTALTPPRPPRHAPTAAGTDREPPACARCGWVGSSEILRKRGSYGTTGLAAELVQATPQPVDCTNCGRASILGILLARAALLIFVCVARHHLTSPPEDRRSAVAPRLQRRRGA